MLKMQKTEKIKVIKLVTIPVNDLKHAFRKAFPDEKVTGLSRPWMAFWGHVLKVGALSETQIVPGEPVSQKSLDPEEDS